MIIVSSSPILCCETFRLHEAILCDIPIGRANILVSLWLMRLVSLCLRVWGRARSLWDSCAIQPHLFRWCSCRSFELGGPQESFHSVLKGHGSKHDPSPRVRNFWRRSIYARRPSKAGPKSRCLDSCATARSFSSISQRASHWTFRGPFFWQNMITSHLLQSNRSRLTLIRDLLLSLGPSFSQNIAFSSQTEAD